MSSVSIMRAPDRGFAAAGVAATVEPASLQRPFVVVETERSLDNPTQATKRRHPVGNAVAALQLIVNAASTFVVVIVLCLAALALVPQLVGYRSVVVASGSMEPSISVADVVVTRPPPDVLPVGAVVDYEVDGTSRIHRIIEVVPGGYRTKGDANRVADSGIVELAAIRGYGLMVVPAAGLPSWLVGAGRWSELIGLGIVLAIAGRLASTSWMTCIDDQSLRYRRR